MAVRPQSASTAREYFKKAPPFAQPICTKLREAILKAEPGIREDFKWSVPVYEKDGLVCSIGAFKSHVGLWFFHGAFMKDPKRLFVLEPVSAKNMRKIHFSDPDEIDIRTLAGYVKEAVAINAGEIKSQPAYVHVPKDLRDALTKNSKAHAFFDSLSYTNRREYVRWLETAKKEKTRTDRLKKTIELLLKGIRSPD